MKWVRMLLWPLAMVYGGLMRLRNLAYDRGWKRVERVPVPCISVGNITVGGTGKTPMAEWLLFFFRSRGVKVAYLSRGYGRRTHGYVRVGPGAKAGEVGDEALQVARRFPDVPVAVCEDRVEGVRRLQAECSGTLSLVLLDDAFQHRRIFREVDLVMVDGTRLPHLDWMLPMGNLREPLGGLKRAGFLIVNKLTDPKTMKALRKSYPGSRMALVSTRPMALVDWETGEERPFLVHGKKMIAFSGLGNNGFFQLQLQQAGARLEAFLPFPDHHPYSSTDLDKILTRCIEVSKNSGDLEEFLLVTTEKDYCRLIGNSYFRGWGKVKACYVRIGLEWLEGETEVVAELERMIQP